MMTKGGQKSQKIDDVFYERPPVLLFMPPNFINRGPLFIWKPKTCKSTFQNTKFMYANIYEQKSKCIIFSYNISIAKNTSVTMFLVFHNVDPTHFLSCSVPIWPYSRMGQW